MFDLIRRDRGRIVPVVGAGLSSAAGGASTVDLLGALIATGAVAPAHAEVLYAAADDVETHLGRQAVQEAVTSVVRARRLSVTPELLALALTPRRLIVTTNYDDAIELAIAGQDRRPLSFGVDAVDVALRQPAENAVHVLHLHGLVSQPESIVLTQSSYDEAGADERLAMALRQLASQHLLVFLGHSLSESETDIQRHLAWVRSAFEGRSQHILLESAGPSPSAELLDVGVNVRRFAVIDPERNYQFVTRAACAIGGSPRVELDEDVPVVSGLAEAYVPMPIAPASEVDTDASRAVWLYSSMLGTSRLTYPEDLGAEGRLLITGGPGFGKTQLLLRMAADTDRPSVYLSLSNVEPIEGDESEIAVLRDWAARGLAGHGGIPRLTTAAVVESVWEFYLDGLDDVPREKRGDIARSIATFARALPHHRWVIASRRPANLEDLGIEGFTHYTLVPSRSWLFELAQRHGVKNEELVAVLERLPGVADLVEIPFYGAAVVAAVSKADELPDSPLGLALYLADQGFRREEPRLRQPDDLVREWLNRLAFSMETLGTNAIDRAQLSGVEDIDRIVERTLLVDAASQVRFPANVVQEARAADVLLRHPNGLQLLREVALQPVDGTAYVRASWRHTVDLLLASTSDPTWQAEVAKVDPLAAARSVAATAPPAERLQAATTIWNWYSTQRLHLPARLDGQLRDDLEAFTGLVAGGLLEPLRSTIVAALASEDAPTRGNAVSALSVAGQQAELSTRLEALLDDADAVVRRRAAEAAVAGNLGTAEALAIRAATDPDELARRTLASAAVRRGRAQPIASVLAPLPAHVRREVLPEIADAWSRHDQLAHLANEAEIDEDWFRAIASSDPVDWTDTEVGLLATAWSRLEDGMLDANARAALAQHARVAVESRVAGELHPHDIFEMRFLLDALTDDELDEIARRCGASAADVIAGYRSRWRATSVHAQPLEAVSTLRVTLADLLERDEELRTHHPSRSEVESLTPAEQEALSARVQGWWADERDAGRSPARAIRRTPGGWTCARTAWQLLEWAEIVRLDVELDEWIAVASADFPSNSREWLHEVWKPTFAHEVAVQMRSRPVIELRGLARGTPQPWSDEIARSLASRFSTIDDEAQHEIVDGLVASSHQELIRSLPTSPRIDAALVEIGDCDAELRLLSDHLNVGAPIPDHFDLRHSWLTHVECPTSAAAVLQAIEHHLAAGTELHDLRVHLGALERCLGEGAASEYDRLMRDGRYRDGRWLWFNLRQFVDRVGEASARARLPDNMSGMDLLLDSQASSVDS